MTRKKTGSACLAPLANWKARAARWHESFSPSAVQVLAASRQCRQRFRWGIMPLALNISCCRVEVEFRASRYRAEARWFDIAWAAGRGLRAHGAQVNRRRLSGHFPTHLGAGRIIERAQVKIRNLGGARVEVEDLLLELLVECVTTSPDISQTGDSCRSNQDRHSSTKSAAGDRRPPEGARLTVIAEHVVMEREEGTESRSSQPIGGHSLRATRRTQRFTTKPRLLWLMPGLDAPSTKQRGGRSTPRRLKRQD